MRNWSYKTITSGLQSILDKAARNPYKTFFLLFAAAAGIAAYVFFSVQDLALPQTAGMPVPKNEEFTAASAAEYRRVFEIMNKRRERYDRKGISVDPRIFGGDAAVLPVDNLPAADNGAKQTAVGVEDGKPAQAEASPEDQD